MPGYNNTVDLDEVHSLSSDYSYTQSALVSNPSGIFSFPQTEPSTDLSGSSWGAAAEGAQNFQEFPDHGSVHSGEPEEFLFTSGQTTPRGSRLLEQSQAAEANWSNPSRSVPPMSAGGQAMSRANSARSSGSSLSQSSHMSNMDVRGNASTFRNGPQATQSIVGIDTCLVLESDANATASQMYWPGYPLDLSLNTDSATFAMPELSPLHVVPAQMQLGPDASLPDTSSPGSWECFSSSISRTSSPATIDDAWLSGPLSPHSSPEIQCQSPRYVDATLRISATHSYQTEPISSDRKVPVLSEDLTGKPLPQLDDTLSLAPSFTTRRQTTDGESARDHALYKNAVTQADGLFHCPWEGQPMCNHKPEKLKCNYDKFVDSHLKPYRCKDRQCEGARFSSTACLLRHEREAHGLHGHGEKPFLCVYEGCERAVPGNGFPRQWNLRDHMKRVHNDVGSASGSPPLTSAQPSKGRKRKTEAPEPQAAPSRKSSVKSVSAPEPKQAAVKPLLEQWLDHRKAVEDIMNALVKPEDVRNIQQIDEVQRHLTAMAKMTMTISPKPEELLVSGHRGYNSTG
ncbi:hypothetical protein B0I35DRAFT_473282 [Stachybotrys elegans]|uniref:C2H2-type domain-containing protein n=1 Tax=Stachybotrys elegans TaxID=80388 RepID=A0A8K0T1U7_9HYPO|nr:hypothetical protein B0I35DRAFT_473282 [Stachybotrys elegans]